MADPNARGRKTTGGASESRNSLHHRLNNYFRHHRKTLVSSLFRLLRTPVQTLMTLLVIAIAMALPAGLYSAVDNLRQLGGGIELNARMSVFLKKDASDEDIGELMAELETRDDVTAIIYLSRERALEEFRQASGFDDVLSLLDENPLPAAMLVQPSQQVTEDPAAAEALLHWLKSQEKVDDVSVDLAWLQKLHAFIDAGQQLALGLGVALGIGVLLVMGNTIRLAIENRREEIVVVKLIGGTNGYVRRPFLYTGFWYGVGGGLLAWGLVWVGFMSLGSEVQRLSALYQSGFTLHAPDLSVLLILMVCGALLGLGGAWVAVASHLRKIEPN
ncbi:MAG: permease-like cell division protein FtsX [Porticoccaceae bacterium]|nr:permease-like cell division protein FtsX [Porticoccaceae bacterium]